MLGILTGHIAQLPVLPSQARQRVDIGLHLVAGTTQQDSIRDVIDPAVRPRNVMVQFQVTGVVKHSVTPLAFRTMLLKQMFVYLISGPAGGLRVP